MKTNIADALRRAVENPLGSHLTQEEGKDITYLFGELLEDRAALLATIGMSEPQFRVIKRSAVAVKSMIRETTP